MNWIIKFEKVENDKNRSFAITSSKLITNWFCKGHLLRNNIVHNYCYVYVQILLTDSEKKLIFVFIAQICQEKSVKKCSFSTSSKVSNMIFDG